jgi:hypothetical protein
MIEDIGGTKILKTSYPKTSDLYVSVADKLKAITEQPNRLTWFIEKGVCSYHNEDDEGKQVYRWPEFKDLIDFLRDNIKEYLNNISVDEQDVVVTGMWVNRYPPGAYIVRHNHDEIQNRDQFVNKGIIIGLVYYIRKDENAGSLVIDIPNYGKYNTNMEEGDVIIFNSSLYHWTTPNLCENDKYTIGLEVVIGRNAVGLNEI